VENLGDESKLTFLLIPKLIDLEMEALVPKTRYPHPKPFDSKQGLGIEQ